MKNRAGFVPNSAVLTPDYYYKPFDGYCAVFLTDAGDEYHLQLMVDVYEAVYNGSENAYAVEILRRGPECRVPVFPKPFPSINRALIALQNVLLKAQAA